jgi:hypothetical protein
MTRAILLISFLIYSGLQLFAQVDEEKQLHMYIVNNRSAAIDVKLKLVDIDINSNTDNYFCWDVCYTPGVVKSSGHITIGANDSTSLFSAYYVPNGETDTSVVEYCFNLTSNVNDTICKTFHFSQFSGKEVTVESIGFSPIASVGNILSLVDVKAYPNPSTGVVNFSGDSEIDAVKVFDLLGKEVYAESFNRGVVSGSLNLSQLTDGVFFLSLYQGDKSIKTDKLILSK